ncbi:MAG: hypothetical protein WBR15_11730 [Gammaproteobacteria bacterium]
MIKPSSPSNTNHLILDHKAAFAIFVQFVLATVIAVIPLANLFITGPFGWFLTQPRVVIGGVEAGLLLLVSLGISTCIDKRFWRGLLLLVLGLFYLRLQNADAPLFATLLYAEALTALGALVLAPWRRRMTSLEFLLVAVICGLAIGGLLMGALSVMGMAKPLFSYAVIVAIGVLATLLVRHRGLTAQFADHVLTQEKYTRLAFTCLYVAVLVIAAKASLVSDYDSLWYGLRPQYVLAQHGSIFVNLGLTNAVYYYPKLFETLTLPLSAFSSDTFVAAFNIFFYVVIVIATYEIAVVCGISKSYASLTALVVGLTPITIATALISKPDLMTAAILLVALLFLIRFLTELRLTHALVVISALCLALTAKLTSIPFGGMLAICAACAILYRVIHNRKSFISSIDASGLYGVMCLALGISVLLLFSYRTFALTGLPFVEPGFLVKFFSYLGFHPHYPYVPIAAELDTWHFNLSGILNILRMIIEPAKLAHIVLIWPGSVYALTGIVSLMFISGWSTNSKLKTAYLLGGIIFSFALVFVAFYGRIPGGDGNYYVFPIIGITIVTASTYEYVGPSVRKLSLAILLSLLAVNAGMCFATSPEWRGGTGETHLSLLASPSDNPHADQSALKLEGLSHIADSLRTAYQGGHCTGLGGGFESDMNTLPCAVDSARLLLQSDNDLNNAHALSEFIAQAHFDFLIVPKNAAMTPLSQVYDVYSSIPGVGNIDDVLYNALDLRGARGMLPIVPATGTTSTRQKDGINLIKLLAQAQLIKTSQVIEPWRTSVTKAIVPLQKYLDGPGIIIRDGATVKFHLSHEQITCPTVLNFRMGLLPIDQVLGRKSNGLQLELIEQNTGKLLKSRTLQVPSNGFAGKQWAIDQCIPGGNYILSLYAIPQDQTKPASVVVVNPMIAAPIKVTNLRSKKNP